MRRQTYGYLPSRRTSLPWARAKTGANYYVPRRCWLVPKSRRRRRTAVIRRLMCRQNGLLLLLLLLVVMRSGNHHSTTASDVIARIDVQDRQTDGRRPHRGQRTLRIHPLADSRSAQTGAQSHQRSPDAQNIQIFQLFFQNGCFGCFDLTTQNGGGDDYERYTQKAHSCT